MDLVLLANVADQLDFFLGCIKAACPSKNIN